MSETAESLASKITQARQLGSVVRTMKTLAASSIRQYEDAVNALEDYYRTVQLGLSVCLRRMSALPFAMQGPPRHAPSTHLVVLGSDQGLVGQFNDLLADVVHEQFSQRKGLHIISVGERIQVRLADRGMVSERFYDLPGSVEAITPLVGQVLVDVEHAGNRSGVLELFLVYNSPEAASRYHPVVERILPIDTIWVDNLRSVPWPGKTLPEVPAGADSMFGDLVSEYLFVSLFRACASSLCSENASRLSAMQRAEKNIGEILEKLSLDYHQKRQSRIDEELFDIVSGFKALGH